MKTADLGIEELQKMSIRSSSFRNQNLFRIANDKTTLADASCDGCIRCLFGC